MHSWFYFFNAHNKDSTFFFYMSLKQHMIRNCIELDCELLLNYLVKTLDTFLALPNSQLAYDIRYLVFIFLTPATDIFLLT